MGWFDRIDSAMSKNDEKEKSKIRKELLEMGDKKTLNYLNTQDGSKRSVEEQRKRDVEEIKERARKRTDTLI